MTVVVCVLAGVIVAQYLLHLRAVSGLVAAQQLERARADEAILSLCDRIQHPDRVQVAPAQDYEPPVPPRDTAELAYVGMEVPEFIDVGSEEQHG